LPEPTVLALFGPTGVGKTAVALELAKRVPGPVAISADALQVYAGLETLTGAATAEEQARLEHRLISFLPVTATFSAGEFAQRAHAEIDAARAAGRTPIVVGGTGLYVTAALTDLQLRPPPPPGLRARIEEDLETRGPAALHAELATMAPERAARIEPTDRTRIVRSLELHAMGELDDGDRLWTASMRVPTKLFGLVMERDALYERIDARVDAMVAAGARDEVRKADAAGATRTARAALGFAELLAGDVDAMKRRTRRYSKRQLTWMRKLAGVTTIDVTGRDPADVAAEIASAPCRCT
jgi:tRNA dimethylallyltransferase